MEKRVLVILGILIYGLTTRGQNIPFPSPGHEGLNTKKIADFDITEGKKLSIGLWLQDRIIYNYANIPGPGGTTFDSTGYYDFFRQRFREGIDVQLADSAGNTVAGTYLQFEQRGGWGGSSPTVSDPRAASPVNNPYNRLQPRGLRYGFVYYNLSDKFNLSAGILPLTDRLGRVLFDADWDFNVGGITIGGKLGNGDYRLGYVRLMDYVGSFRLSSIGTNSELLLADYDHSFNNKFTVGGHLYALTGPFQNVSSEMWMGFTAAYKTEKANVKGRFIYNSGKISGQQHSGTAAGLEGGLKLGKLNWSVEGWFASGDADTVISNRFVTLHQLIGTAGYWGYTHIFTPNGPSDVNDLGLEIGNNGAGLTTLMTKLDYPLIGNKLMGQLFGGWFSANVERNGSANMGIEAGGMLTYAFADYLKLETGVAYAGMGNFFGNEPDHSTEVFSRLQFTW